MEPNKSVNYFAETNKKSYLDESELAFITLNIGPKVIQTLAETNPTQFKKADVDNSRFDYGSGWIFAFDVLQTWNSKTGEDSKKGFILHLYFYIIPVGDPSFE